VDACAGPKRLHVGSLYQLINRHEQARRHRERTASFPASVPLGEQPAMSGRQFFGRASWTLVDQCVVSGGNFLLNVLLARVLSAENYGEFALFLGAIFLLRTIDYSFISYPVSLRLALATADERPRLLGNTALLTLALSLVLVVAMACGAGLLGQDNILLPACVCYLCWQAHETPRRVLLGDCRFSAAVAGDAVAYVGQVLLIASLLWLDGVTLARTLYVMSATFVLGAFVHASQLRFAWPDLGQARRLALEYASIGKWSVINYQLVLIRVQLFPWMLAAFTGTAATASFQACMNISSMTNPVIFGIGNAIPQVAAGGQSIDGVRGGWRASSRYLLFGLAPIVVICAGPVLVPELLLQMAYGPASPYVALFLSLQLLAISSVLDYVAEVMSKTLLGVNAGKQAFLVNVASVIVAAGLFLVLVEPMGVLGAGAALVVANLVRLAGGAIALAGLISGQKAREQTGPTEALSPLADDRGPPQAIM
jgi:O-antigen/teichoic acid export membrane protein